MGLQGQKIHMDETQTTEICTNKATQLPYSEVDVLLAETQAAATIMC
jgi:hypothetical protein